MTGKVRCKKCSAEFSAKDLSGNVRTVCPVCRTPVADAPESAPPPVANPSTRPAQPVVREVVAAAVVSTPPAPSPSQPRAAIPAAQPLPPSHRLVATGSWEPPLGLSDHAGYRLDASKSFPWGPPPEIGQVLCADSNVPRSGPPSLMIPFLTAAAIFAAVYLVFGEGLHLFFPGKGDPNVVRAMAVGLGLLAGGLTLAWMWPAPLRCTYVGKEGAAYFTGRWGQSTPSQSQVILFRESAALYSSTTHFYKNLIYERTMFRFDWHRDAGGASAMTIADEHAYKDDLPTPGHRLHFALRLEDVWTHELIARLGHEPSADRTLSFPCRKSTFTDMLVGLANRNDVREIRLNRSEVQFVYDDRVESLAIRDLESFQAKRGVLKFEQHDASWFSRQGKFRIDYQHLGNAKAFLYYLSLAASAQ